jgi:Glycine-zipper domain
VGAVSGAIAGDAGTGAAVGAATGGLIGGMKPRGQAQQQQAQANQAAQQQSALGAYNRLPQFIKLNFTEKTLSTTEAAQRQQSTPIKNIEQVDSSMILQGVEGGRAWSLIIAKETGKMSTAVADDQVGFVVFGACTPF